MQHSVPVVVLSLPRRVRILMENTYYLVEYEVSGRVILEEAEEEGDEMDQLWNYMKLASA